MAGLACGAFLLIYWVYRWCSRERSQPIRVTFLGWGTPTSYAQPGVHSGVSYQQGGAPMVQMQTIQSVPGQQGMMYMQNSGGGNQPVMVYNPAPQNMYAGQRLIYNPSAIHVQPQQYMMQPMPMGMQQMPMQQLPVDMPQMAMPQQFPPPYAPMDRKEGQSNTTSASAPPADNKAPGKTA